MSDWKDIASAPRDGTQVLLIGRYPTLTGWSDVYHSWAQAPHTPDWATHWCRWPHAFEPTHWMPLPDPPSPQQVEGEGS